MGAHWAPDPLDVPAEVEIVRRGLSIPGRTLQTEGPARGDGGEQCAFHPGCPVVQNRPHSAEVGVTCPKLHKSLLAYSPGQKTSSWGGSHHLLLLGSFGLGVAVSRSAGFGEGRTHASQFQSQACCTSCPSAPPGILGGTPRPVPPIRSTPKSPRT